MKFKALVREVMNKDVITIEIEDSIKNAAMLMKKHRIGSLVVVGAKKIKGIITAEDIVYKHVADNKGVHVNEIMSENLIVIEPAKTIEEASDIMVRNGIKKLPVMEGNNLVGMITATDIMRIEPVLYETLLERMKISGKSLKSDLKGGPIDQCEICGNYSDDINEVEGEWVCSACREIV